MKTLSTIEEILKLLEQKGATIDEALRILAVTQEFLIIAGKINELDPSETPAEVLKLVRARKVAAIEAQSKKKK